MIKDEYIEKSCFGIERETLRVNSENRLSQTPHPFSEDELSRDFCENQLEIITPVCKSIDEAVNSLKALSLKAKKYLNEIDEKLWIYSNPPHIENEDEIPVAEYTGIQSFKHDYRIKLWHRYGKRLMLFSGIHFNMSFSDEYFENCKIDKNEFYLHLLKQSTLHSWLLVMLTAASPVYDKSLDGDGENGLVISEYSSLRNSERGYWNQFVPVLDYSSLHSYCESIQMYIDKGALFSEGELYVPVRIKNKGENSLEKLIKNGIDHIELRMFDLNPLAEEGVFGQDLKFAYYFMAYLSSLPDFEFTPKLQLEAVQNHKNAARYNLSDVKIDGENILSAAEKILLDMKKYYSSNKKALSSIEYELAKLEKNNFYAKMVYENCIDKISEKLTVQRIS